MALIFMLSVYFILLIQCCENPVHGSPVCVDWSVREACLEYDGYEGRGHIQLVVYV